MTAASQKVTLFCVTAPDPFPVPQTNRTLVAMLGVCTVVLVAWALSAAESVFAPLAFAFFIIAIAWPLQRRLQARMPQLLALALTMAATILVVVVFASLIAWATARVGRFVVNDAERLQALYGSMSVWLESHGIELAGLWANYFSVDQLIRLAQQVTTRLNTAVSFLIVVFIYVLLGLLEVDDAYLKLRGWPYGSMGEVLGRGGAKTAVKLRRYMLVRTLMSAVTGLLVWAFAWLAGLPLAVEWGVIAFALNFIPFIGPFIATVFPTVFAIAQFELVADGTARFRVSQRHPIRGGKLSGATVRRQRNVDFALCRFVRGFFLDFSLGSGRGVHWHSDCHRSSHALRGASLDSLDCRPFRLASA